MSAQRAVSRNRPSRATCTYSIFAVHSSIADAGHNTWPMKWSLAVYLYVVFQLAYDESPILHSNAE